MKDDVEMELYDTQLECERLRAEIYELKQALAYYKEKAEYYKEEAAENYGSWQAVKSELEELQAAVDNINLNGGHY